MGKLNKSRRASKEGKDPALVDGKHVGCDGAEDPASAPLSPVETLLIPPAVNTAPQPELPPKPITDMKPECLLASTLSIKGDMTFERLLRIDGKFEGTLTSNGGSLIVGITGDIKCNLTNMKEVYIEGKVTGDISAEYVQLRKGARVVGDIECC
eukprot:19312-Heterococcus_DN1.PRE.2